MALTYHFSVRAPGDTAVTSLKGFLENLEGDAKLMGFDPTHVVAGPFDSPDRKAFAKRVARGLVVEDSRLRPGAFQAEGMWQHGEGFCRLAPLFGVFLIVTAADRETVFGFFKYPNVINGVDGCLLMKVAEAADWIGAGCVTSPDQRYRSIIRRFAEAGYLDEEIDEYLSPSGLSG